MISHDESQQRPEAMQIVDRVIGRLQLAELTSKWLQAIFWIGLLVFGVLLSRRLCGLWPELFTVEILLWLPILTALIALCAAQKPTSLEAARKIDTFCGTSDLFLTLVQLKSAAGEYQSLPVQQADLLAAEIVPSEVVPWDWHRPVVRVGGGAAVLISAILFLPQLDPFGVAESGTAAVAARRNLQESRRETAIRAAELSAKHVSDTLTHGADESLAELAAELRQLTADRSASSLKSLEVRQREIEARWREARSDTGMVRLLEQAQSNQFFGGSDNRGRRWTEELAEGQTNSLDEAFESLRDGLEKLASAEDGVDRKALEKQVRQQMAELQRFAGNQLQSQSAEAAMKRAMSQLDSARLNPDLQTEAVEAARESIELGRGELHELAKNAEQLAAFEKALNAIQSAKQLTQDGTQQPSDKHQAAIQEFVEQYAKMEGEGAKQQGDPSGDGEGKSKSQGQQVASAAGQSESKGSGKVGAKTHGQSENGASKDSAERGPGRSASRENNLAKSDFRDARERASLDTTRRLLAMRRQGLSDAGETSQEYRELVRSLQKRVSTAIEVEEIPPGYVSGIRSYFDSLDQESKQEGSRSVDAGESKEGTTTDDSSEAADGAP
jgi:hypothetical protein